MTQPITAEVNESQVEFQKDDTKMDLLHEEATENKASQNKFLKFHGIFYATLSAFFLSLSNIFIKSARIMSGSEQSFVRYVLQLLVLGSIIIYNKDNFLGNKKSRKLLMTRGLIGTIALISLHFAVKLLNPSDAVALLHLNTVIVAIAARIILKEKINLAHVTCLIMSMVGVVFIAQPSLLFSKHNEIQNNYTAYQNNNTAVENEFSTITNGQFILGIILGRFYDFYLNLF